ncbi:NXPE family member 3-like protein [Labeo rohita]|uniref:NXPE family member 3-like protein n=1 Tax=Labeo rohita TaxID=84645 RepID=A0A498MCU3_LABRO|nr:NXPE family member 3-like protein [Labeo rohita]
MVLHSSDAYSRLQQAVYWDGPDRSITNVSMSTSPAHTTFIIENLKESYQIGDKLFVTVHAKNFENKSKSYGGDFFQAKLFWSKTKASVFGEVVDLLNGSYSVRFLLPWVGEAQVAVRLIHSSEAVQVLKRHRDTDSDRVYFNGYYEGPGPNKTRLSETVTCNVNTRHFTTLTTTECLKNKHIYMMGDSTMRQWFEFFVKTVSTLKQMNLHVQYQSGPLIAVDVENNIDLHWRAHCVPLRTLKSAVADLHYISNEIDDQAGGPHTVFIFNLGPHFTTYPLDFYTHRVLRIRKAVLALLQRAPDTTVIIKTVNTGYKDIFGSDWYSLLLNRVLHWAFQDVGVYILDVWQMTACHYSEENIHPGPVIKNEIDILLSFICPD